MSRPQADASTAALCDFLYEACSSVPVAAFDHPRLRQALALLGAAAPPRPEITQTRQAHYTTCQIKQTCMCENARE